MKEHQPIEFLVRRLYEARLEAKAAKQAVRDLAEKIGKCEMHWSADEAGIECYNKSIGKEDWCDICKQKLPAWENYHAKTNAAAGALRTVLNAAKRMQPIK